MEIISKFHNLSLGKQLQVLFTASSFVLITVLILISKYQIEWIQEDLYQGSYNALNQKVEDQLIRAMLLNSNSISTQFSKDLSLATYLSQLSSSLCTGTFPLAQGTPTFNLTYAKLLNIGLFFTSFSNSSMGNQLVLNQSSLDPLFPLLFGKNLLQMYSGFELDHMFQIYPAESMPENYNPTVREWYYTAKASKKTGVFTEPYIDSVFKIWIISASKSIYCNNIFTGVSAVDITLESIRNALLTAELPNDGFFMLVSANGMVVTMPYYWYGQTVRLNDTAATGFSSELWQQVIDTNYSYDYKFEFTDKNNTDLLCYRSMIIPNGQLEVTHYLFACALKNVTELNLQSFISIEKNINVLIFWTVFSVATAVLIVTVSIINFYARKITKEIDFINKSVYKILEKSLYPDSSSFLSLKPVDLRMKMFGLVQHGVNKFKELKARESLYSEYEWGHTRPADVVFIDFWRQKLYPKNLNGYVQLKWRSLFVELVKKTIFEYKH